jgi:CRP/FNR family transcriptional regulator, cyclic AMP receptor protein
MLETFTAHPLLRLDPDLAQLLTPERLTQAEFDVRGDVASIEAGVWDPRQVSARPCPADIGVLILDGVIMRELYVHETPSGELFGPGDIIRGLPAESSELLEREVRWHVLERASVASMDRETGHMLRRYPEVMAVVLDRLNARAERLAVTQAISQITGVHTRIEALLWHLAERWGRVSADGVIMPLRLSHRMIGALVGARRPTVSSAIARLADQGRVARRFDGTWLLLADAPPTSPHPYDEPLPTHVTMKAGA